MANQETMQGIIEKDRMEIESLKYAISQFEEQNKTLKQQNTKLVYYYLLYMYRLKIIMIKMVI